MRKKINKTKQKSLIVEERLLKVVSGAKGHVCHLLKACALVATIVTMMEKSVLNASTQVEGPTMRKDFVENVIRKKLTTLVITRV